MNRWDREERAETEAANEEDRILWGGASQDLEDLPALSPTAQAEGDRKRWAQADADKARDAKKAQTKDKPPSRQALKATSNLMELKRLAEEVEADAAELRSARRTGRALGGQRALPLLVQTWDDDQASMERATETRTGMTPAAAAAVINAVDVLRHLHSEPLTNGGRLFALTDECSHLTRKAAAVAGIPAGELAEQAAWSELAWACGVVGASWPSGPHKLRRAAEIVARARAMSAGDLYGPNAAGEGVAGVRVLASGIDSLNLSVYETITDSAMEALDALRDLAQNTEGPYWIGSGPHRWRVEGWAPTPFRIMLTGPACTIRIARPSKSKSPQVYIEFRAAWLWRQGAVRAVDEILEIVHRWSQPGEPRITVSRLDACTDVQGLALDGGEMPAGRYVSRATTRAAYFNAKKKKEDPSEADKRRRAAEAREWLADAASGVIFYHGAKHTGVMIGKGARHVVIYDKTQQIKDTGRAVYMPGIWAASGAYVEGEQVFRVEVRFRGAGLKDLVGVLGEVEAGAPTRKASTAHEWRHARKMIGGLWRWMLGRPDQDGGGWLTLREKGHHGDPDRWPIDPRWRAIQQVPFGLGLGDAATGADMLAELGDIHRLPDGRVVYEDQLAAINGGEWDAERWRTGLDLASTGYLAGDINEHGEVLEPCDAAALAEVLGRPEVLSAWGPSGPPPEAVDQLRAAGIEIVGAEGKAHQLKAQAVGTFAAWVAQGMIASGDHGTADPRDWAAKRLLAMLEDPEWVAKVDQKRATAAIRGAAALGRHVLQGGDMGDEA